MCIHGLSKKLNDHLYTVYISCDEENVCDGTFSLAWFFETLFPHVSSDLPYVGLMIDILWLWSIPRNKYLCAQNGYLDYFFVDPLRGCEYESIYLQYFMYMNCGTNAFAVWFLIICMTIWFLASPSENHFDLNALNRNKIVIFLKDIRRIVVP